jgi:hypothetical protein
VSLYLGAGHFDRSVVVKYGEIGIAMCIGCL